MKTVFCPRCKSNIDVPDLPESLREEIVRLRRTEQTVMAFKRLSEKTGEDLRFAKRLVLHLPHVAGKCHRCDGPLPTGGVVDCPKCRSVNVQWSLRGEEAA